MAIIELHWSKKKKKMNIFVYKRGRCKMRFCAQLHFKCLHTNVGI